MSFKMFISYTSEDRNQIEPFLDTLKAISGFTYYFYEETKAIAQKTKEDIKNNIRDSNAFLVFHSQNSLKSAYVQHEIGVAEGVEKPVVIANLDGSKPDGMLQGTNYLDFSNERIFKRELDRLVCWVESKVKENQETAIVKSPSTEEPEWAGLLVVVSILAGFYLMFKVKK